jgi:hypothetical protein
MTYKVCCRGNGTFLAHTEHAVQISGIQNFLIRVLIAMSSNSCDN